MIIRFFLGLLFHFGEQFFRHALMASFLYRSDSFDMFPNPVLMNSFFVFISFASAIGTWTIRRISLWWKALGRKSSAVLPDHVCKVKHEFLLQLRKSEL